MRGRRVTQTLTLQKQIAAMTNKDSLLTIPASPIVARPVLYERARNGGRLLKACEERR